MISSSVGSGHPEKYSYEMPHEYLPGWGNLSGKYFQLNVITSLIWDFFQMVISLLGKATYSHFLRVITSTQQLLF